MGRHEWLAPGYNCLTMWVEIFGGARNLTVEWSRESSTQTLVCATLSARIVSLGTRHPGLISVRFVFYERVAARAFLVLHHVVATVRSDPCVDSVRETTHAFNIDPLYEKGLCDLPHRASRTPTVNPDLHRRQPPKYAPELPPQ